MYFMYVENKKQLLISIEKKIKKHKTRYKNNKLSI